MGTLGEAVLAARQRTGLNQTEFAALIELDRPMLSKHEHGHRAVTLMTLERVVAATGLSFTVGPDGWQVGDDALAEAVAAAVVRQLRDEAE